MIFIQRTECPDTLKDRTSDGDHYNKPDVVHALWDMQHGKCCYCERMLPEKGHLKAVEHFAPKAVFKALRNEWTNLLLACSQCNGRKSDKFPVILSNEENEDKVLYVQKERAEEAAIIDPSQVNPEKYIDFDFKGEEWSESFGVVMAKDGNVLGKETIFTIGLHEPFYAKLRCRYYCEVILIYYRNLLQAYRSGNKFTFRAEKKAFESLMAPETELAGFTRAFARFKRLEEKPIELDIPSVEQG